MLPAFLFLAAWAFEKVWIEQEKIVYHSVGNTFKHVKKQTAFMKKMFFILSLSIFSCSIAQAQNTPDDLIKTFFAGYQKNSGKAIDDIYLTNPWAIRIKDAIENIKKEVGGYTADYMGAYYGYERIVKKQLSESFILYSFLVKYDRQPLRFTFEFYKPNDAWRLFSFKIDGELDDEIEQAAKLYYLNLDR